MASSTFQSFGGLLNNAGYLQTAGYHQIQSDAGPFLKDGESIQVPWITGPSPTTLFKAQSKPNVVQSLKVEKPCDPLGIERSLDTVVWEFKHAPQSGYKRRDANTEQGPRGTAFLEVQGTSQVPVEGVPEAAVLVPDVINSEAARYRWGLRQEPPRYGEDLKGSSQISQRSHTPGKIVMAHKSEGWTYGSGYHSGWNSIQYNATGTLDPTRPTQ